MRPLIEQDGNQTPAPLLRSRIGRRVVSLFIFSALVPLTLCAVILFRAFDAELHRAQEQSLDGLVRSFGMTVFGRLGSADDVLEAIASAAAATDQTVLESVSKLTWVRAARRVEAPNIADQLLPTPDVRQRRGLEVGHPILLWGSGQNGGSPVYLVRSLPSGAWLYAQIDPDWLWSGASEFAGDAGLAVADAAGRRIASAGAMFPLPSDSAPADPKRWISRSWELFLAVRFSSPSWRFIAVRPHPALLSGSSDSYLYLCAFVVLTILMISVLSMASIRRQMRPLDLLTLATRRVAQRDFEAFKGIVLGLPEDPAACRLAESIIVMCGALGKSVIAEGVETEEQRDFLRRAGCTTIQGYLLGRPMEAADFPGFARRLRSLTQFGADQETEPAALRAIAGS